MSGHLIEITRSDLPAECPHGDMRLQVAMIVRVPYRLFRDPQIRFIRLYFMSMGHYLCLLKVPFATRDPTVCMRP